jgi:hypothetical protein
VPTFSGGTSALDTLSASTGGWSMAGLTFTYQWYANGDPIDGATSSTLTIPSGTEAGTALTVQVTASRHGYGSTTVTSGSVVATDSGF